jgi:alkaline phosphatase
MSFTKLARLKRGETAFFSWILYRSKAHRNAVNKKVMKDERIAAMMTGKFPFDPKRMAYGGFRVVVDNP